MVRVEFGARGNGLKRLAVGLAQARRIHGLDGVIFASAPARAQLSRGAPLSGLLRFEAKVFEKSTLDVAFGECEITARPIVPVAKPPLWMATLGEPFQR